MFKSLTIKARIISVICLLSATSIVVGWVGLSSLDSTSQALKSVYEDRLVAVSHLNAVQAFVQQNQTTVGRAVIGDTADMAGAADEIEQRIAKIGTIVERHLSNYPSAEEKALAKRLTDARKQFVGAGLKPAINALRKQDRQAASEIFKGPVLAIKELIGNSVEKVDAGSALVGQAGSTMEEIVESVKRVTDIMGEIMTASQEQSAGIEQVNQAIGQMDQVTQQNAALVEEAAAAAESLQEQAARLAQTVSVFKVDGMGIAHQPASRGNAAVRTPRLSAIKPGSKRRNKKFSEILVSMPARPGLEGPSRDVQHETESV